MVCHQNVRVNREPVLQRGIGQRTKVILIVPALPKASTPVIPALNNVQRNSGHELARLSGHAGNMPDNETVSYRPNSVITQKRV
jgi:hypothetical protein